LTEWFWNFMLYSFLGYLVERLFAAAARMENQTRRCLWLLPLCPVYGLAMTAVYESFDRFETAEALTEQLIAAGCPDGIFVSSYVAPAVCACLQAHGLAGRVRVIGVDIWEKSAACLEGGTLTAAICQNQQLQAMRAVDMLVSMMRGDAPAGGILIKPELVMPSAMRYYM